MTEEEIEALKKSMKVYFTEGEGKDSGITSLYVVRHGQRWVQFLFYVYVFGWSVYLFGCMHVLIRVFTVMHHGRTSPNTDDMPCELVTGDEWIHEELLGLKFRISPHSFFQVNTSIPDNHAVSVLQ